jgi:predicted phage terminase large subunit-like protein
MPPRHGKTELASIRFAPWFLGRNPDKNIIQATYAAEFAEESAKKSRSILSSPVYEQIFDVKLAQDSRAVSRWQTNRGGSYYAVGVGGPLTGRGANLLVVDDPHKNRQEAESVVMRANVWEWFTSTAYTRLEDNASAILIMTRWHEDDLAGRLLRGDEHWEYLSLPAIAEQDEPYRKHGEALWPQKFDVEALENIRCAIGSREWASLYQQQPSVAEGEIFKREWWHFYSMRPHFQKIVQSWDTAFKKGKENDFSVCTTWGVAPNGYYLIHVWKEKVEFPELKRAVVMLASEFAPDEILIEDKASGQSLLQEIRQETRLPITAIKVDADKIARAYAVTPTIEAGNVFLPENAAWVRDYVDSLAAFPNAAHDDDVDSTTQALAHMKYVPQFAFGAI